MNLNEPRTRNSINKKTKGGEYSIGVMTDIPVDVSGEGFILTTNGTTAVSSNPVSTTAKYIEMFHTDAVVVYVDIGPNAVAVPSAGVGANRMTYPMMPNILYRFPINHLDKISIVMDAASSSPAEIVHCHPVGGQL